MLLNRIAGTGITDGLKSVNGCLPHVLAMPRGGEACWRPADCTLSDAGHLLHRQWIADNALRASTRITRFAQALTALSSGRN